MAWPSNLVRTKDWTTEILTDSDLEGQFDLIITYISDMMDSSSGHKHDGTANEGPQISLNGSTIGVTGELQETDGGTGLSAYTAGDVLYASASNTLSALAIGSAKQALVVNSGGTNVEWGNPGDLNITSQAQGDILYYNGSNWVRLAAGTSGEFLKTNGAAANPEWDTANFGNAIFSFVGNDNSTGQFHTAITTLNPNGTNPTYAFWGTDSATSSNIMPTFKWVKRPGIDTVTYYARIWMRAFSGSSSRAEITVDIGGQSGTVTGGVDQTSPEAVTATVDVSSLSDGTAYDVNIKMRSTAVTDDVYCSAIVAYGSG